MEKSKNEAVAEKTLVIERVFDAPRRLVFEAWTKKEHLDQWCVPEDMKVAESNGEFRVGGGWYTVMVRPDGEKFRVGGVYQEIVPDKLLVMTHGWFEDDGSRPHETIVTVRFSDENDKTRVRLEQAVFRSVESRDGHNLGWSSAFNRLDRLVDQIKGKTKA